VTWRQVGGFLRAFRYLPPIKLTATILLLKVELNTIKTKTKTLICVYLFIIGTASLDPKSNGKISLVSLSFILVTNFLGTLTGTVLCVLINPGRLCFVFNKLGITYIIEKQILQKFMVNIMQFFNHIVACFHDIILNFLFIAE
jgi:hypothetical protein